MSQAHTNTVCTDAESGGGPEEKGGNFEQHDVLLLAASPFSRSNFFFVAIFVFSKWDIGLEKVIWKRQKGTQFG